MRDALETALRCLIDGLPIPLDVEVALLSEGIDVSSLSVTPEEQADLTHNSLAE